MAIEVTVRDTESGESETQTIENDVIVVTAGTCYVAGVQDYIDADGLCRSCRLTPPTEPGADR